MLASPGRTEVNHENVSHGRRSPRARFKHGISLVESLLERGLSERRSEDNIEKKNLKNAGYTNVNWNELVQD
jgi:hypothetical protein